MLRHIIFNRGASPLGLPYTRPRSPLRRLAPVTWLARALARDAVIDSHILFRNIRPTRARDQIRLLDAHFQFVRLAVEFLGRECERVLTMKLVGDSAERRAKIVGGRQLE